MFYRHLKGPVVFSFLFFSFFFFLLGYFSLFHSWTPQKVLCLHTEYDHQTKTMFCIRQNNTKIILLFIPCQSKIDKFTVLRQKLLCIHTYNGKNDKQCTKNRKYGLFRTHVNASFVSTSKKSCLVCTYKTGFLCLRHKRHVFMIYRCIYL